MERERVEMRESTKLAPRWKVEKEVVGMRVGSASAREWFQYAEEAEGEAERRVEVMNSVKEGAGGRGLEEVYSAERSSKRSGMDQPS